MTILVEGDVIRFEGRCRIEDAEILQVALCERPGRGVDLGACTSLHSALVQLLLVASPPVRVAPAEAGVYRWLMPLLQSGGGPFGPRSVGL